MVLRTQDGDVSGADTIAKRANGYYSDLFEVRDPEETFVRDLINRQFDVWQWQFAMCAEDVHTAMCEAKHNRRCMADGSVAQLRRAAFTTHTRLAAMRTSDSACRQV